MDHALNRRVLMTGAAAAFAASRSGVARAQGAYPARPIRFIVPYAPGGPTDVMARLMLQQLAGFGQFVIDNRPGAGSTIGYKAAMAAEPDGYTLFSASSGSVAIAPALYPAQKLEPLRDLAPIAMVSSTPYVMVISPKLPVTTLAEFIAYAQANPGTVNFGAPAGTPSQLLVELFKTLTGTPTVLVPYKGGSPVITDIMGGQVQATFEQTSVLLPHIQEGKVRAIAVAQDHRIKDLPGVPTTIEAGVPRLVGTSWTGVAAPAGTPPEIVAALNAAINEKLRSPDMIASMAKLGSEPIAMSVPEFTTFVKAEGDKWGRLVEMSGAKGD